ncbi:hypothetical protein [Flavobacterium sedimenticola]|uniref:DUF559 domain-containing protein n=1 Tax=Flavobacterium sedimenticola TaxID=3043286 RepID=A0ABT6XMN8_9FLAO|nr:hypothetical protein [Flavobacterium sedimenticola]MDI9256348.1 hypothetical protein [Flavobacterium sedimenticola]
MILITKTRNMAKRWSDNDLKALEKKGMAIIEQIKTNPVFKNPLESISKNKKITNAAIPLKVEKISVEKNAIEFMLKSFYQHGIIPEYVKEHRFDEVKGYRFDWAIPSVKLAIEYEGLFSEKSGHTTIKGYVKDCKKYNLATINGWKILRYTAVNYSDLAQDIELFFSKL